VFDFGFGDGFPAVAVGNVRGPEVDLIAGGAEVDDEVSPFLPADGFGPPHFHEVAGFGVGVGGEVYAAFEVGEEFGGPGAVGIPAAKDFFAVFDPEVGVTGELGDGENGGVLEAELRDDAKKDEVSGAGAEGFPARFGILNDHAVFQDDAGGEAIDRFSGGFVAAAVRHGLNGGEDVLVEGRCLLGGLGYDLGAGRECDPAE